MAALNLLTFHSIRAAIQVNAAPGDVEALVAVETQLRERLLGSGLFEEVEVGHTDDVNQLIIALCTFRPFYTEGDVAERLEAMWDGDLRYPFWEAHAVRCERDHVEFEGASRASEFGHYVTVHLVAQRSGIPAQRTATS